ncbi:MAG: quinohemoprotein amine dehydrogenase subunit alpha [Vicinamibacterales bacterium]
MVRRWLHVLILTAVAVPSGAATARAGQAAAPTPAPAAAAGIPVESDLVLQKCGGCHRPDEQKRMTRISFRRASPENWELTIKRMVGLHGIALAPAEARAILKYLADNHGLAPEELRPARWEAERRQDDFTYAADASTTQICSVCHSLGRVLTERRTKEEWDLLIAMHRGYYPGVDSQPMHQGQGFRRTRRTDAAPGADNRDPVVKVVAHLSTAYPLITPEWTAWSAAMRPASVAGRWAVAGYARGKGPVYGEFSVQPDPSGPDAFITQTTLTVAGTTIVRRGRATVYTGYQWRGRASAEGETGSWREVMLIERNNREMSGRWFTGAHDEIGLDVTLTRVGGDPLVSGASLLSVRTGTTQMLSIYGANLPASIAPEAVSLGSGVRVANVTPVSAARLDVEVSVAADARIGPRDIVVAGAIKPAALVVYGTVDAIKVLPEAGFARVGGIVYPKQFAQFEAIGFTNGPDGEPGTKDDLMLGPVEATWTVEEYTSTFGDDDRQFSGSIDAAGFFTPAVDGPNPERSGNRNNIGDLWVVAQYTPAGAEAKPLKARGFLLVAPPVFMRWYGPRVDAGGEK